MIFQHKCAEFETLKIIIIMNLVEFLWKQALKMYQILELPKSKCKNEHK